MNVVTRPIGEIFRFEDTYLKVIKDGACESCYFKNKHCSSNFGYIGDCRMSKRADKTGIHFEEVKDKTMKKSDLKVGMVVERRNGVKMLVMETPSVGRFLSNNDIWCPLTDYTETLEYRNLSKSFDIVKVYKGAKYGFGFNYLIDFAEDVIWEREKPKTELTLEQIAEKFNIPVESLRIKDQ